MTYNNGDIVELTTEAKIMYINEDMFKGEVHLRFGRGTWGWFPLSAIKLLKKTKITLDREEEYNTKKYELECKHKEEKDYLYKEYYDS